MWLIGWLFHWSLGRIVLLGFVINLSRTAVVLKLIKDRGELDTPVGNDVLLLVLLAQDLAVVPMLIVLGLLGDDKPDAGTLALQALSDVLIIGFGGWLRARASASRSPPKCGAIMSCRCSRPCLPASDWTS